MVVGRIVVALMVVRRSCSSEREEIGHVCNISNVAAVPHARFIF